MTTKLPELLPDDYKDKDAQFWKEYREILYEQIKEKEALIARLKTELELT